MDGPGYVDRSQEWDRAHQSSTPDTDAKNSLVMVSPPGEEPRISRQKWALGDRRRADALRGV